MWWSDPLKEVLYALFNRLLAPYVENLDLNQVNYGLGTGQLTLKNLRLKREALDKFRLPVDVLEGYLGLFTVNLSWKNLTDKPLEIVIENVYLLAVPGSQSKARYFCRNTPFDPEEDERRAQAAKFDRLENAELLQMKGQDAISDESQKQEGLVASLLAKVISNVQITVRNVHIRYEDKLSCPGHPFAAGITLSDFKIISVNDKWEPAFIQSTKTAIHKLAKLESLAIYFNTDSESMAGLGVDEALKRFTALASPSRADLPQHQFIVKPVSGEGKITINPKAEVAHPKNDVELQFNELAFTLDDHQYRDIISLIDMYHFYLRQHQYHKYRPTEEELDNNRSRALLRFAGNAILQGVHDKNRRWTWQYFAERRDDRHSYVRIFKQKLTNQITLGEQESLDALEKKLSYEDIRFYRSIARSQSRKDQASRRKLEEEKKKQQAQAQTGWTSWIWGSGASTASKDTQALSGEMTDEQRKELYDAIDYDEKAAVANAFELPREAQKMRINARLHEGSFSLSKDPHGSTTDIISINFNGFQATLIQRPDNMEAALSLGSFSVFDGTTPDSLYKQIVRVKEEHPSEDSLSTPPQSAIDVTSENPFLSIKYESNPLTEQADNALSVRMQYMEVIYHRGYIEAIYLFFKPPESQLESVEALLDAATQTLQTLSEDTRTGLEYALQSHKTIDIQLDISAPIIIIPEDVTIKNCSHLVIDAGHISIESDLVDKQAVEEVRARRNDEYNEEDLKRLESLMYDKFTLRLKDAQFLIGHDLQSCIKALRVEEQAHSLHLLERVSIELGVQISIIPSAVNLARFKVSGKLPNLTVNLSDEKYKALMRFIDVAIPNFDDGTPPTTVVTTGIAAREGERPDAFRLRSAMFSSEDKEYIVEEDGEHGSPTPSPRRVTESSSRTTSVISSQVLNYRQHVFELGFEVQTLKVALLKSAASELDDQPMGSVMLSNFGLQVAVSKYDMVVQVGLKALSVNVIQEADQDIHFISSNSSGASAEKELMKVSYTRAQKDSPVFKTQYGGIDQNIDMKLSTLVFELSPRPVISMYDFIMTTFVPNKEAERPSTEAPQNKEEIVKSPEKNTQSSLIRLGVTLDAIKLVFVDEHRRIATLALSTADVVVLVPDNTLRVTTRLGNMSLVDDSSSAHEAKTPREILSIEGGNFAEVQYRTFDSNAPDFKGINSFVELQAASVKVNVLENPLHDLYAFLIKFAQLKALYDAATSAAVQRAAEITRMAFQIKVQSPIIVFPGGTSNAAEGLVVKLGEIGAKNSYRGDDSAISASLSGILLESTLYDAGSMSRLKILDNVEITTEVVQVGAVDRTIDLQKPDTQVNVKISDVKLSLTQQQYCLLMTVLTSTARIFSSPSTVAEEQPIIRDLSPPTEESDPQTVELRATPSTDLAPEISRGIRPDGSKIWSSLDVILTVNSIRLQLFDASATNQNNLKNHGIARFALNDNTVRFKVLSDGSQEAELTLRSFTIANTLSGTSKFREIIPAAQHDRNQFMVLYTSTGGLNNVSMAVVTIDSPRIIFTMDPVFALMNFFQSAFPKVPEAEVEAVQSVSDKPLDGPTSGSKFDFRVDLYDVSISILASDSDASTQAIQLTMAQLLMSQQGILAITLSRLGMSLVSMDKPADSVRILDETDISIAMDSRRSLTGQLTNIEVQSKPIVLRASYRDITLMTAIANKALELSNKAADKQPPSSQSQPTRYQRRKSSNRPQPPDSRQVVADKPRVLMSKEQLKATIDGFRLVLIGDLQELPILHLQTKPLEIVVKDWSGQMHASTTVGTEISYWNLKNSHWEPLLDPWVFSISASKELIDGGLSTTFSSRERLDMNISSTFLELALGMSATWSKEGERVLKLARGGNAPYRIRNRTGGPLQIWSDFDGSQNTRSSPGLKVSHGETVDWRFDDWKTMREQFSATGHNSIGLQFIGKPWDQLRSISVDTAGEYVFSLRPKTSRVGHRLLVEVTVQDSVKVVTLRSTYKIENLTLYPLEVTLVDEAGHPAYALEKIGALHAAPGQEYSLPIEAAAEHRVRVQPDQGFGYKWSAPIAWEDLAVKPAQTIKCSHRDNNEAPFRFQAWAQRDGPDTTYLKYPRITLKLRAPIELENLLPYDLKYRVYDKNADQNWNSYLRRGGVMPVHSVDLRHLVLLNINLQDSVFKTSDFAIINTDRDADFDVEKVISLSDSRARKLDLRLHYLRYPDSGGAFKVQIYSPYIVINKTGLPFSLRSLRSNRGGSPKGVAGDENPDTLSKPNPFLLSHPSEKGTEFVLKINSSGWSKILNFEAPNAETEVVIPSEGGGQQSTHVGLSWAEGLGKYKLSKVITIAPRFIIKNNLSDPLCFREHGVALQERAAISPQDKTPLLSLRNGADKLLTFAYPGLNTRWSPPINIEEVGTVHLRVYPVGESRGKPHLLRADISIAGATIFIVIHRENNVWPFRIENNSDYPVSFLQAGDQTLGPNSIRYEVHPHSALPYAWDYPAAYEKKLRLDFNGQTRIVDLMEMGNLLPFKFTTENGSRIVSLDVRADGTTQVLELFNYQEEQSVYKLKRRNTASSRQDSVMGSEAFEAITEEVPPSLAVNLDFEGLGLSLINQRMAEVVYLSLNGLKFDYTNSDVAQTATLSVEVFQIDNQLHESTYPVVLQPTPVSSEVRKAGIPPSVQASIILLNDEEHGVLFVKYASILLQAMTIQVDEDFLFALYDLTKLKGLSWEDESENILIEHPVDIPEPVTERGGQNIYFELLELQPIQLSISFMRTERVNADEKLSTKNPLAVVVNALTMAVGNINDAPLQFNALGIKDVRLKVPELQDRILYHYRQEVLRQLYRILGSADFLGNPVGLFTNVSSGVADIFYEPYNGVVMHGNKELGIGIAKGAASFFKKTVFGFSDSMTKVTSSLGKGLSAATLDDDYQNRRRLAQRRNKPRHAIYGVTAGAEALATSVASGFEGVVMKPLEGAERGGAVGFFKGVGKGLVGAVTKPVVGVFDLASNVSEGIRNTTTVFDSPERDRIRRPRVVPADGVLTPYSRREALGQSWMRDLEKGEYRNERYVAHLDLPGSDTVVLLTASRVLCFTSSKLRLVWDLPLSRLSGVQIEDTGVRFSDRNGREYDKFVRCPDRDTQGWFFSAVAKVVKAFNAQRRIER
ncbi:vacuolar protein sorting-associated protein 13 [Sistotremastrum niveocremeum HHB9708]|uniref:Vacuolar protein sorting-associated protein 13 n=1 Tax=Sistotremastrum niveocremeum HHB9708 TaxID=1314777 RepID=A0A164U646_9AGAM|nr:vacuolar protein sorting-associated protein 13 [Sistotremastrum niveocremeum HHB9708]